MSHTKGPWAYRPETRVSYDSQTGEKITRTSHFVGSDKSIVILFDHEMPVEANGHLIAAAPEMLEALQMMFERLNDEKFAALWESTEEHSMEMEIYEKVIKKARGES